MFESNEPNKRDQQKGLPVFLEEVGHVAITIDDKKYTMASIAEEFDNGNEEVVTNIVNKLIEQFYKEIDKFPVQDFKNMKSYKDIMSIMDKFFPLYKPKWEEGYDKNKYLEFMNDIIKQMSGMSQEEFDFKIQEFYKEATLQLEDNIEDIDKAPGLVLFQFLFGMSKGRYRGRIPSRYIKDYWIVIMFKEMLLTIGRVLCATVFRNLGRGFKIYLLEQILKRINVALSYLDKRCYKGPIKDWLLKLKERVEKMIAKEIGHSIVRKPKMRGEDIGSNPRPTDRDAEASPRDKEAANEKVDKQQESRENDKDKEKSKGLFDTIIDALGFKGNGAIEEPLGAGGMPIYVNKPHPGIWDKFTNLFSGKGDGKDGFRDDKFPQDPNLKGIKDPNNKENLKAEPNKYPHQDKAGDNQGLKSGVKPADHSGNADHSKVAGEGTGPVAGDVGGRQDNAVAAQQDGGAGVFGFGSLEDIMARCENNNKSATNQNHL